MAITLKEYELLWEQEKIKSGLKNKDFDDWIENLWAGFKKEEEAFKNKLRWMCFVLDRTIRNKTYNYIEIIERSMLSHLRTEHNKIVKKAETELRKIEPEWNWSTDKIMCAFGGCCTETSFDFDDINCLSQRKISECNIQKINTWNI